MAGPNAIGGDDDVDEHMNLFAWPAVTAPINACTCLPVPVSCSTITSAPYAGFITLPNAVRALTRQVKNPAIDLSGSDCAMQEIVKEKQESRAQSILKIIRMHGTCPVGELSWRLEVPSKLIESLLGWLEKEKRVKTLDGIFWELGERPMVFDGYDFEPICPELVVLCGPSHSGKSTFANRFFGDCVIISSDKIREQFDTKFGVNRRETEVWKAFEARKRKAARDGYDIVLDACHMSDKAREHAIEGISRRYRKRCFVFDLPLRIVWARCLKAERLPLKEVERMWRAFQDSKPSPEELKLQGFDAVCFMTFEGDCRSSFRQRCSMFHHLRAKSPACPEGHRFSSSCWNNGSWK
jgi:predicted kinase